MFLSKHTGMQTEMGAHKDQTKKVERSSEHKDDVRDRVVTMCHNGPGLGSRLGTEVLRKNETLNDKTLKKAGLLVNLAASTFQNCQK
jgi:hypothetical protein